jgi:hypothetical protein
MATPLDRIRLIQDNYDSFCYGSSEEYREALPMALRDLALGIAFMTATAEFCTDDTMRAIFHRTEALLAAGRVIAKAELRQQAVGKGGFEF